VHSGSVFAPVVQRHVVDFCSGQPLLCGFLRGTALGVAVSINFPRLLARLLLLFHR
jgi:hypothetical protein